MTNKNKAARKVPELRFPEFRDAQGWKESLLGDVAVFAKGKGISKSEISSNGSQPCIRYGELYTLYKEVINSIISRTNLPTNDLVLSQANDVIIPASGETQIDIATASCVLESGVALGGDLNIIRSKMDGVFLSYYLNNAKKKSIAELAQGISVFHLYASQLKTLNIDTPEISEQQKVAHCLASLDDIITAQVKKIEILKVHKKGLMQHLFPAEGKTIPRLRFPEFLDAGEWKEMCLGNMLKETVRSIKMSDEQNYGLVTVKRRYGGIVLRNIRNGKSIKVKTQFLLQENDFLISKRQIIHNACGLVPKEFEGSIVSNEYSILKPRKNCNIEYINWFSQHPKMSESFRLSSRGIVIEKMLFDLDDWLKRKFLFPSLSEQQKIADCLCSLTDLITAHTQKLDALKTFKKGLMQRLFPSTFEGEA